MTPNEIQSVARSWVGHISTDQNVRTQMAALLTQYGGVGQQGQPNPARDAAWADLINQTLVPSPNVQPADVPGIRQATSDLLAATSLISPEVFHACGQYP